MTGGAGFIGSHVVEALLLEGWKVKVLDCNCIASLNLRHVANKIELIEGSFGDRSVLHKALPGVDTLLHLASTTTPAMAYGRSAFDVETNLIGTLHLLEEALAHGISRVIFPSSGGTVYGQVVKTPITEKHPTRPLSSHGIIKLAIENYIQMLSHEKGLKYTILRIANPYGPRQRPDAVQGAIAVFAGKILTRQPIELWGDGRVVRDFIYIDDLIQAIMSTVSSNNSINKIINIGSGIGVSIKDLVSLIEESIGISAIISYKPTRKFDVPVNILSIKKAKSNLTWLPKISLKEGLERTIPWIEQYIQRLS